MKKDTPTNGHRAARKVKAPRDGHNENNGNGKAVIPSHFASRLVSSVPHSRKGKHNLIVSMILEDLDELEAERAILIPIEELDDRATRQREMVVATATDEKYFYVWRTEPKTKSVTASLNAGPRNSQS